jgi:hypothetical protein
MAAESQRSVTSPAYSPCTRPVSPVPCTGGHAASRRRADGETGAGTGRGVWYRLSPGYRGLLEAGAASDGMRARRDRADLQ